MSTTDEILQALGQAGVAVAQGLAAANGARGKAEQAIAQSAALGAQDKIREYSALKGVIDELIATLNGSREKAVQVLARARAAAG